MKIKLRIPKKYIVEAETEIEAYSNARAQVLKELRSKDLSKQGLFINIEEIRFIGYQDINPQYKNISIAVICSITTEHDIISSYLIENLIDNHFPSASIIGMQKNKSSS